MNRTSFLVITILSLIPTVAYGQSLARVHQPLNTEAFITEAKIETSDDQGNQIVAERAITALKRLGSDVFVYRSLGDFEENGKLARVPFAAFKDHLQEVRAEVAPLLSRLPQGKLKSEISNALDSYRDGAFWWQKIDQPRVVNVSALGSSEITRTPSDAAFLSTVPYTVAIHWRQAGNYLKSAEKLMNGTRK